MSKVVKYVGEALGKPSLVSALKAGGWKVAIDGSLADCMIGPGKVGKLVGVDQFGNKYYENTDAQIVRDRWVVYAGATHYTTQEPTQIPPEWHGWLNHITDENPTNSEFKKPIYAVEAKVNPSGTVDRHQPKGSWFNPEKRTWRKFEAWTPGSA